MNPLLPDCLTDHQVAALVSGAAPFEHSEKWNQHVAVCYICAKRMAVKLNEPNGRGLSRASVARVLEAVESNPRISSRDLAARDAEGPLQNIFRSLLQMRLSRRERDLLIRMNRAGGRAVVRDEPGQPRHILINGKAVTDDTSDTSQAHYLEALEVGLVKRGYVVTFNGRVYELTAKGRDKAERLR